MPKKVENIEILSYNISKDLDKRVISIDIDLHNFLSFINNFFDISDIMKKYFINF